MTISPIRGRAPAKCTKNRFGLMGCVDDIIICFKCYRNRLRGFRAMKGQKWGSSIDFESRPYNRSALPCCVWQAKPGFSMLQGFVSFLISYTKTPPKLTTLTPLPTKIDFSPLGRCILQTTPAKFSPRNFRVLALGAPAYACSSANNFLRTVMLFEQG